MSRLLCERNRSDYMHATGAVLQIPVKGSVECGLELPEAYAVSLLGSLETALEQSPQHLSGKLRLDVPFWLHLDRDQIELLVKTLREAVGR